MMCIRCDANEDSSRKALELDCLSINDVNNLAIYKCTRNFSQQMYPQKLVKWNCMRKDSGSYKCPLEISWQWFLSNTAIFKIVLLNTTFLYFEFSVTKIKTIRTLHFLKI